MKKIFSFILLVCFTSVPAIANADETKEVCPSYNFSTIFYDDYYPGTRWSTGKEITWSHDSSKINNKTISKNFSNTELVLIREAIKNWDDVLETISFKEVLSHENADINIGFVDIKELHIAAYWGSYWTNYMRHSAYIEINSFNDFNKNENQFKHVIQHEVGNVLGLGDMYKDKMINSVFEDPLEPPFGNKVLSDFDIGMMRQLYGESTCPSSFFSYKNNDKTIVNSIVQEKTVDLSNTSALNIKNKYSIVCVKNNKKITIYRYNKDYPCLRGYVRE
jgi:hypothetical protein